MSIDTSAPLDSVRIRIVTTNLQVDQTDGITWVVDAQQDMYFRQGKAENGEDPAHWLLYRWDDSPPLPAASELQAGGQTSWGNLKFLYGN